MNQEITAADIGRTLLTISRATLAKEFGQGVPPLPQEPWLQQQGACFVTLHQAGQLRGCIGSMLAYRPLLEDLQGNTRAAAFDDPRFPALEVAELDGLTIEVSLLSSLEPMEFESEEDLIRQLRPGLDGLLLDHGVHRGTFLPAVWQSLADAGLFLRKLKAKAGLPEDFWSLEFSVKRYTTQSWSETELQG